MTGEELRSVRKSLKLTQAQLARRLGLHWVTIAKYETGKYLIPLVVQIAIESLYGIKPSGAETYNINPELETAIVNAEHYLLHLGDNWDGQGNCGYDKATLNRATEFLRRQSTWLWRKFDFNVPIPDINPGPDGTIDLDWKQPSWELLINIPKGSQAGSYYGENAESSIKGSLNLDTYVTNVQLILWLTKG
jgi:transcriptional regulator with XRE-family HTH domain